MPKLSITGDLGSGKSTVARALVERLDATYVSTGNIQRALAAELGLTTLEMNHRADVDPTIDVTIDGRLIEMGKTLSNAVFDSRLAWHFVPDSTKIYLKCDPNIAAQRVKRDQTRTSEEYVDEEQALVAILARKKSENNRFLQKYGVDCADLTNFDVVIDTSDLTATEVVEAVIQAVEAR